MNSGRNPAFRKELLSHLEVKTADMFLLVDLNFETIFKISTKISSGNIQVPQFPNGSHIPKVYFF
jgi:hypothetical protein